MNVTPAQIRAARALLRLDQAELAFRAHVSVVTVRRLEAIHGRARVTTNTLNGIRAVLEQAGAEFIPDGVRKRQPTRLEPGTLLNDLRAISLRSAERLEGHEIMTDADLYGEDGLPA